MTINERKSSSPLKITLRVIISLVFIAVQIFIYYLLFVESRFIPHIYLFSTIVSVFLVIHLYNSNDNISYKLTWTIFILLFNVVGPLFYLLFGGGRNLPLRKDKKITNYINEYIVPNGVADEIARDDLFASGCAKFLTNITGLYPYHNEGSTFYNDGMVMFQAMLDEIDKAKRYICLEYFIIASGKMLDELLDHLEACSKRGIEIKILGDYVGCNFPIVLKLKDKKRINSIPNLTFETFNPLGINLNLGINYRDHRKILIIDGEKAFVGGINIADEYIHKKERFGIWRDNGMKIEGEATYNYVLMFFQNWYMSTKEKPHIKSYKSQNDKLDYQEGYVFPFGDGPYNRVDPIYDIYLKLINCAEKRIYISTPYFVIDKNFVRALVNQAKSGVEVVILVPGIPDKKIVYTMAYNSFYELECAGVKLVKFKGGFNHAKTLVIDDKYAIVGTVNIDYRSMFLHFECCNLLVKTKTIEEIIIDFENCVKEGELFGAKHKSFFFQKTVGFILSVLGPLV